MRYDACAPVIGSTWTLMPPLEPAASDAEGDELRPPFRREGRGLGLTWALVGTPAEVESGNAVATSAASGEVRSATAEEA